MGHHVVAQFLRHTSCNVVCLDKLNYSGDLNRLADELSHEPKPKGQNKICLSRFGCTSRMGLRKRLVK